MIDINLIRENPTLVKENMKKKFQDEKVGLVDEAYKLDKDYREVVTRASEIRSLRNKYSKEIGALMREGKRDEAEEIKAKVTSMAEELKDLEVKEEEYGKELKEIMMKIPNIIHEIRRRRIAFVAGPTFTFFASHSCTAFPSWQTATTA